MTKYKKGAPSLLENAINSISIGLQDFRKSKSDPRRIASCVRNLYAGVLLLFKQRLIELSPPGSDEILIKREFRPEISSNGDLIFKGVGKKTIEYAEIQSRFESLKIIVDWKRMDKIRNFRNDVEHYHSQLQEKAVRGLISDVFLVVRNFIKLQLKEDPAALLGSRDWQTLLRANDVYEKEKRVCRRRLERLEWPSEQLHQAMLEYRCDSCDSGLIMAEETGCAANETEYTCRSCQKTWAFEEIAEQAIVAFYADDNHLALKDGGSPTTIQCPACTRDTYHLDEDVCLICGDSVPRVCERCGTEIPWEEISGEPYCDWCLHMMNKDD